MRGDVGERSGACGGCSASSAAFAAAAAAAVVEEEETDLSATTLGTSCSSASPGTAAPLGAWTAAALRMSEVYVCVGRGCAAASENRRRRPATTLLLFVGMRRAWFCCCCCCCRPATTETAAPPAVAATTTECMTVVSWRGGEGGRMKSRSRERRRC